MKLSMDSEKNYIKKFMYIALIAAFLNTVLRPAPQHSITLYRILSPIIIFIGIRYSSKFVKSFSILLFIIMWSFIVGIRFSNDISYLINYSITYLFIFILYMTIKILQITNKKDFEKLFFKLLYNFYVIMIITFIFQYITKIYLPNVKQDPGYYSTFFWTGNDFGSALATFMPLIFLKLINKRERKDLILIIITLFSLYINDAKIALMGSIISCIIICILYGMNKIEERGKFIYFHSIIIFVVLVVSVVIIGNPSLKFRDKALDVSDAFLDPLNHIVTMIPYDTPGSIYDRTDAIIYGVDMLRDSEFLGVGIGNSIQALTMSEYNLRTAKSLHNVLLQFIVENGIVGIIIYLILVYKILKICIKKVKTNLDIISISQFIMLPISLLSSSVGLLSNYYVWAVIIYLCISNKRENII